MRSSLHFWWWVTIGDKCRWRKDWLLVTKSTVNNQLSLFSYPVLSIIINRSYEGETSIFHIKTSKNWFKRAHLDKFDWWTSYSRLSPIFYRRLTSSNRFRQQIGSWTNKNSKISRDRYLSPGLTLMSDIFSEPTKNGILCSTKILL